MIEIKKSDRMVRVATLMFTNSHNVVSYVKIRNSSIFVAQHAILSEFAAWHQIRQIRDSCQQTLNWPQVRDEYRTDFDAGRGGYGQIMKTKLDVSDMFA
jgi:hypothetical protein